MTGKLTVEQDGRVTGPASIRYNEPWPCQNGDDGGMSVPHGIQGLIVHTMVGNLNGTIEVFNTQSFQASAHFGVDQEGNIHQFGGVRGWKAWAQEVGNPNWYSCEFADDGNPDNPLTQAQIVAAAQLLECLSAPGAGNFPVQITNSTSGEGLGVHSMGGQSWGGHTCPDEPPNHVRSAQRPQIVALAMAIRSGSGLPSSPPSPSAPSDWQEAILNALPTLQQGSADHAGAVMFVHRAQALVKVIGQVNNLPAAAGVVTGGVFTADTTAGVKAIQAFFKLTADGIVGPVTWRALVTGSAS